MSSPPFRLVSAATPLHATARIGTPFCCDKHAEPIEPEAEDEAPASHARLKLHQLHAHFHCSVIGTCLTTAGLRKLIGRHVALDPCATDQDVHSSAVGLAEQPGEASKALHKALDRRHAATLVWFGKARDSTALERLWTEALERGEIPGAYWALLTHRETTDALRSQAFGDVHMLSHLVGASNRADIRRLVALEHDMGDLTERFERQQARVQALIEERDGMAEDLRQARLARVDRVDRVDPSTPIESTDPLLRQVALQTERRERAEQRAVTARAEAGRAVDALAEMQSHAEVLARELAAAEAALQALAQVDDADDARAPRLAAWLQGRRVAYIGGRPSSTPAIRALVQRHGGRFAHHDGGLEDRKGLLTSTIVGADLVAFPMDCIDHDSVNMIKRLCARHGVPFLPLRTASATSLMSALANDRDVDGNGDRDRDGKGDDAQRGPICLKHG